MSGAAVGVACVAAGAAAGIAVAKQLRGAAAGWWKEEISSAGRGEGEEAPEVPLAVKVGGLLSSNSEELRSASAELRRAIRDSRARIGEMEARLQSSRTEVEAARGDTRALEAQLDELRGIAEQRARALQAAEESFRQKEEELAQGLKEKTGELDLMNAVVEDLRSTVREEQKLREEAERALVEEARLRDEATQKMEAMNKMIERMERKAGEKARLLEAQEERFEKLSGELKALVAKAEAELADEAAGRQEAEGELAEMRAAKQEIDRQMEELQIQSNKAKELDSGLAESQKAAVAKAREQEQQLQKLRAELEAALKASDGKTREFATLESRLSLAQEESSQREGRLKVMEEQVRQANAEAASKEEELGGLKAEVVRLEEGIAAVQAAAAEDEKKMVQELQRLGEVVETEVKGSLRPAGGGVSPRVGWPSKRRGRKSSSRTCGMLKPRPREKRLKSKTFCRASRRWRRAFRRPRPKPPVPDVPPSKASLRRLVAALPASKLSSMRHMSSAQRLTAVLSPPSSRSASSSCRKWRPSCKRRLRWCKKLKPKPRLRRQRLAPWRRA